MPKTKSEVKAHNGLPTLHINGEPVPFAAYMSYLDDKARYSDFAGAGCKLFTYPVYFAGRGINVDSGIGAFRSGIFDIENFCDFSVCDHDAKLILDACPDAYIFPRICLGLPEWWEEKYPQECNFTVSGERCRESMSSKQWRGDAGEMLRKLICHMEKSDYADNVIGYQVAAGGTEEWVHFKNGRGGLGPAAQKGFGEFAATHLGPDVHGGSIKIPTAETYRLEYEENNGAFIDANNKALLAFLEYTSWIIADCIKYFCSIAKECCGRAKIAGAFYGYSWAVTDPRSGHLCLSEVLKSEDVDFICSPNAYSEGRKPGIDWPSMPPLDSIRLSGKMMVNECDTRTHLTRPLKEARPSIAPKGYYEGGVWAGPERADWSLWLLRRCFARSLVTGAGLWWFDMWGGWYASQEIMAEMKEYFKLQKEELCFSGRNSINQVAAFNDEQAMKYLNCHMGISNSWVSDLLNKLGSCGCGYDVYDVFSADEIKAEQYRLMVFGCVGDNAKTRDLIRRCREKGVNLFFSYQPGLSAKKARELTGIEIGSAKSGQDGTICVSIGGSCTFYCADPSPKAVFLRAAMEKSDVHLYADFGDVVYANRHFLCIHAATGGKKRIKLPKEAAVFEFQGKRVWHAKEFDVDMAQYETLFFRLHYGAI